MEFRFIDAVGLEIEGCWAKPRNDLVPDNSMRDFEFKKPYFIDAHGDKRILFGELISVPFKSLDKVISFLDNNWIDETGSKCGYHVHISFKDYSHYCHCMSETFYNNFLNAMSDWGRKYPCDDKRFWERLEDRNKFCRRNFIPDTQVAITKKVVSDPRRYCILNFCWGMHKTLECRLFPTFFDVEMAKSATIAFLEFIEDYLGSHSFNPIFKVNGGLDLDDENQSFEYKFPLFSFFSRNQPNTALYNIKIFKDQKRKKQEAKQLRQKKNVGYVPYVGQAISSQVQACIDKYANEQDVNTNPCIALPKNKVKPAFFESYLDENRVVFANTKPIQLKTSKPSPVEDFLYSENRYDGLYYSTTINNANGEVI